MTTSANETLNSSVLFISDIESNLTCTFNEYIRLLYSAQMHGEAVAPDYSTSYLRSFINLEFLMSLFLLILINVSCVLAAVLMWKKVEFNSGVERRFEIVALKTADAIFVHIILLPVVISNFFRSYMLSQLHLDREPWYLLFMSFSGMFYLHVQQLWLATMAVRRTLAVLAPFHYVYHCLTWTRLKLGASLALVAAVAAAQPSIIIVLMLRWSDKDCDILRLSSSSSSSAHQSRASFFLSFPSHLVPATCSLLYLLVPNCVMCLCYSVQALVAYKHHLLISLNTILPECRSMEMQCQHNTMGSKRHTSSDHHRHHHHSTDVQGQGSRGHHSHHHCRRRKSSHANVERFWERAKKYRGLMFCSTLSLFHTATQTYAILFRQHLHVTGGSSWLQVAVSRWFEGYYLFLYPSLNLVLFTLNNKEVKEQMQQLVRGPNKSSCQSTRGRRSPSLAVLKENPRKLSKLKFWSRTSNGSTETNFSYI